MYIYDPFLTLSRENNAGVSLASMQQLRRRKKGMKDRGVLSWAQSGSHAISKKRKKK